MPAYFDKIHRHWRYDFMVRRKRYTGRGYPTRRAALDAEAHRRDAVKRGHTGAYSTFAALVDDYLTTSARTKSASWCYQLKIKLNRGFGWLAELPPHALTRAHFERSLNELAGQRVKASTVNEYRKIAHSVMEYAVTLEVLTKNPVSGIPRMPESATGVTAIPTGHLRQLILGAKPDLAELLLVLSQTGARFVELQRLKWTDVVFDHDPPYALLTTRKQRGGSERRRPQPLTALAVDALRRIRRRELSGDRVFCGPTGGRLDYETARKRLVTLCDTLKLPGYGFHEVRHWAATVVAQSGANRKAIATFLGQTSMAATDRYVHVVFPEVRQLADRLSAAIGGEGGVKLASDGGVNRGVKQDAEEDKRGVASGRGVRENA